MRNLFIAVLFISLIGCKSKQRSISVSGTTPQAEQSAMQPTANDIPEKENHKKSSKASKQSNAIIKTAMNYNGTPYRYGGTTRKGMDCSGLVYVSFKEHDIPLQRTSAQMATEGKKIKLKEVEKGDLLFFTTSKNKKRINHVGLVVSTRGGDIQFIHSTTSRGVLVSSLSEGYWNYAFNQARRIL
ncbi:C40 family peptidase [Galbibacter sp.]|jgi:cell wall-associated NlpC family hydrolase|uniref:C40 family peptidase n=1 Tax=Galbibacter sp. TaxID=2918471 RepID=UPI003A8D1D40